MPKEKKKRTQNEPLGFGFPESKPPYGSVVVPATASTGKYEKSLRHLTRKLKSNKAEFLCKFEELAPELIAENPLEQFVQNTYHALIKIFEEAFAKHFSVNMNKDFPAFLMLATLHRKHGNKAEGMEFYRKIFEAKLFYDEDIKNLALLRDFSRNFYYREDTEANMETFQGLITRQKNCRVKNGLVNSLLEYWKAKLLRDCFEKYEEALTLFRTCWKLWKSFKVSKKMLALQIGFNLQQLLLDIGLCHRLMHNYTLAVKVFQKLISECISKERFVVRMRLVGMQKLGFCLFELGRFEEANESYKAFVRYYEENESLFKIDPDFDIHDTYKMVKGNIAAVLDKTAYHLVETAKKVKDPLDKTDFKDADDLYKKAIRLESQQQWSEAFSSLEKSLELIRMIYNQKVPLLWVTHELALQVRCLANMDKCEEAIEKYQYLSKLWENIDDQKMKRNPYFVDSFKIVHEILSIMYAKLKYLDEELECNEWIAEHVTGSNSKVDLEILSCSLFLKIAINYELGNYEKVLLEMNNFKKAEVIESEFVSKHSAQIYNAMALEKLGKYSNALDILSEVPKPENEKSLKDYFLKYFRCQGNCQAKLGYFNGVISYMHALQAFQASSGCRCIDFTSCKSPIPHSIFIALYSNFNNFTMVTMIYRHDMNVFWSSQSGLQILNQSLKELDNQWRTRQFLKEKFKAAITSSRICQENQFVKKNRKNLMEFYNSALITDLFRNLRRNPNIKK